MKIIVNVDKNWGIGCGNKLLYHIPADMKMFRETTTGKTLVMGYNTFMSLPGARPLPNRRNIVLSRKPGLKIDGAEVAENIDALKSILKDTPQDDVYIIGGAGVYREMLDLCDTCLVTKVDSSAPADTFFPDLDKNKAWIMSDKSPEMTHDGLRFWFCVYSKKAV